MPNNPASTTSHDQSTGHIFTVILVLSHHCTRDYAATLLEWWHIKSPWLCPKLIDNTVNDHPNQSWLYKFLSILSGWWFEPLWKIWKSIGMIIPNIWENKIDVPNHQPVMNGSVVVEYSSIQVFFQTTPRLSEAKGLREPLFWPLASRFLDMSGSVWKWGLMGLVGWIGVNLGYTSIYGSCSMMNKWFFWLPPEIFRETSCISVLCWVTRHEISQKSLGDPAVTWGADAKLDGKPAKWDGFIKEIRAQRIRMSKEQDWKFSETPLRLWIAIESPSGYLFYIYGVSGDTIDVFGEMWVGTHPPGGIPATGGWPKEWSSVSHDGSVCLPWSWQNCPSI